MVNMTKTSGHGCRGGCGLSEKNDKNVGWRKTARMAISHPRIWRKHGSPSWRGQNSNTTGGTVCGEEGQRNCGRRARETKLSWKHENVREASGKPQVRPKNSEKCVFILNCVKQNAYDDRKPRGFPLPQIERLRDSVLLGGRQRSYMAKLDLSICFCSLCLPRSWVGEFSVCVGDAQYVWQSLPFGWKYSPLLCQKFLYSLVRMSLCWLPVLFLSTWMTF